MNAPDVESIQHTSQGSESSVVTTCICSFSHTARRNALCCVSSNSRVGVAAIGCVGGVAIPGNGAGLGGKPFTAHQ